MFDPPSGSALPSEGPKAPRDPIGMPDAADHAALNRDSLAYREMIASSLLNKGNNARLKRAIANARDGKPVTLAYIGGSITHGAGAAPLHLNCYAYRSCELFRNMFAPADEGKVRLIKAGVGGTPSELGIVRYERDVLREGTVQPDIVVVEFAVNDADDETEGVCYESLVLQALQADNKPAVILLFSVFENDWNLQDRLAPLGWHYDLPMVSIKDAVVEQFGRSEEEGRVIGKAQFFHDIYHPTNAGHQIMADCLGWLFETTHHSFLDAENDLQALPPLIGDRFVGMKLIDRKHAGTVARVDAGGFCETDKDLQRTELDDHSHGTPLFPDNWMHTASAGKAPFRMTLQAKRLIMVFKDSGSDEFGTANVRVNGAFVRTADPHQVHWTRCHAMLICDEEETEERTVEISMADHHGDRSFTILGFGYVP